MVHSKNIYLSHILPLIYLDIERALFSRALFAAYNLMFGSYIQFYTGRLNREFVVDVHTSYIRRTAAPIVTSSTNR